MLGPIEAAQNVDAIARLRLRSPLQINRAQAPVRDGLTLPTLRATGGPPASVSSRSSGPTLTDGGRRRSSVFDLPTSGQGFLERLKGQAKSASPLLGAFSASAGSRTSGSGAPTRGSSLTVLQNQNASLQPKFQRLDNSSRFLPAQSNENRFNEGFELISLSSDINLLG